LKIQDGGGRHLENHKNAVKISATVWPIFTKFGISCKMGFLTAPTVKKI